MTRSTNRHEPVLRTADEIASSWENDPRWKGVERFYLPEDVVRLRGKVFVEHSLARQGAERLWRLLNSEDYVPALGAMTGVQAVQMVKAGLKAIYISGWQVAADANLAGQTYPDQSLYPANSVPTLVRRINHALLRADQIHHLEDVVEAVGAKGPNGHRANGANGANGAHPEALRNVAARASPAAASGGIDWMVPLVADGEAGFGGPLNTYELTKGMIEAGAAGVHYEDQLASAKKCGHMGGKVLIPASQQRRALTAARLAADVLDIPTVLIARTDARGATLLSADTDARDKPFLTGVRTVEGFHVVKPGIDSAIARALAYAPYADLLWVETDKPSIEEAEQVAAAVHAEYPGKLLAYNCSPSFHWRKHLDAETIEAFQARIAKLGYKFQFVTLAGFHALSASMFQLADGYRQRGMGAYVELQDQEFQLAARGYSGVLHQREAGTTYFDDVARTIVGRDASTLAHDGSTEAEQFQQVAPVPVVPSPKPPVHGASA